MGWAWFFGKFVLWMLSSSWSSVVGQLKILYAPSVNSVIIGTGSSMVMATITLICASRKHKHCTPIQLLNGGHSSQALTPTTKKGKGVTVLALLFSLVTLLVFVAGIYFRWPAGPTFFGAGSMALFSGLLFYYIQQRKFFRRSSNKSADILLNIDRRPARKVTVAGILATGVFLVLGAGAFHQNKPASLTDPSSRTGGFSHFIYSSLPLYDDLSGDMAANMFDLQAEILKGLKIVPLRVKEGDEASCLNLNKSQQVPLFGVKPSELTGHFPFAVGSWSDLDRGAQSNVVPALVDQNTMLWALGKKKGDRISYEDELGNTFEVELSAVVKGTVLQGEFIFQKKIGSVNIRAVEVIKIFG